MSTTLENKKDPRIERSHGVEKTKILIVDDEVAFTNIVKLTLELNDNYEICIENDSRIALDKARRFRPDIIILDVVMPELDGGELYRQFKADPSLKNIPILFLTAILRQEEVDESNGRIGGRIYLAKPASAERLIDAIEIAAVQSSPSRPPGEVKQAVLVYLQKNREGKAIEIAKLCGLTMTSVTKILSTFKKNGVVTQDKKHGSPFVLVKK